MYIKGKCIQVAFIALGVITFHLLGCQATGKTEKVPVHPIARGVSAPFAGFIDHHLLVGGGCNFPHTPAAEGGKKVYYAHLFAWDSHHPDSEWQSVADLPFPIAYSATVETQEGLICIGGMNDTASVTQVIQVGKDQATNTFSFQRLPSLPEAIDNASATAIGQSLYVTGGNQEHGGNALYTLSLHPDSVWRKLANYPGPKRIQPVLLAGDNQLFLFGGYDVQTSQEETTETKEAILSADFLVYDVKKNRWSEPQAIPTMQDGQPRALVGCAGTRVDQLLILAGGVNYTIFKTAVEGKATADYMKHPADWYQFSKDVLVYDLHTQQWKVIPNVDGFNKAGGSLVHHDGSLYMVCGEIKPGIRTNEIVKKELKELFR